MLSLGTVRRNRIPFFLEFEIKKEKKGYILEQVAYSNSTHASCVSWFYNKPVNFLSTFAGTLPIEIS